MHAPDPTPGETTVRVSRFQGKCSSCDFEGLVIQGHDDRVMSGLHCPTCILAGNASTFAPEHAAMRPIVFVARAMRGDEPFRTLLESAEKQRENPEAHRAAVERNQRAIAQAKQRASDLESAHFAGKSGRAARRAADAIARKRSRASSAAAKRAKLRGGD